MAFNTKFIEFLSIEKSFIPNDKHKLFFELIKLKEGILMILILSKISNIFLLFSCFLFLYFVFTKNLFLFKFNPCKKYKE